MIKDILHIKAPGNWINDPNGFIYYKGNYHLFYQYFPYAPEWGTMHWGHAVSEDLVHWQHLGVALYPTKDYDRNGIFSGSAMEKDGELYLYYSAVKYLEAEEENIHLAKDEKFETSQAMIISEDGVHFDNIHEKKQIIPVIYEEEIGHPTHTRDPKVWKHHDRYYMILGSTITGIKGRVLFYTSTDGRTWNYTNQYTHKDFGTVLECPDLFELQGQYVFQGSPMHIMDDGLEYASHPVCALADFGEENCELCLSSKMQIVDYGLDLYAPQTNIDKDGNRVMIAWMRMPKAVNSNGERGVWNGMMCVPRIMEIRENHIYFRLHPQTDQYLSREIKDRESLDWKQPFRIKAVLKQGGRLDIGGYQIVAEDDRIRTDRSKVFGSMEGYRLKAETPELGGRYELDILVDENLIEIFVNEGQYVLSHVVYNLQKKLIGPVDKILSGAEDEYEEKCCCISEKISKTS